MSLLAIFTYISDTKLLFLLNILVGIVALKKRKFKTKTIIFWIILLLIFAYFNFEIIQSNFQNSFFSRTAIWTVFIAHITSQPNILLFGNGSGLEVSCMIEMCDNILFSRIIDLAIPHNVLIATIFDHGLFVTIFFILLIVRICIPILNCRLSICLFAIVLYMLLNGRSFLALDVTNFSFFLFIGLIYRMKGKFDYENDTNKFR